MINDEELLLYYYRDGLSEKRMAEIKMALERDPKLADRLLTLSHQLDQLEVSAELKAPAHAMHRWHTSLDRLVSMEQDKPSRFAWLMQPFQFGAALASAAVLVLTLGVLIGLNLPDKQTTPDAVTTPFVSSTNSFVSGLRVFLQETEMQLASLNDENPTQRQALITEIISRNRMYQMAAENSSDPGLARVLRAFELVLMSIANEQSSASEIEAARMQLAFELTVMQTKLARATSKQVEQL